MAATDGTRLVPRYMHRAEQEADRVMWDRAQAAADADAGLARLVWMSAEQEAERAQQRAAQARDQVDAHDTALLTTTIRQYLAIK